MVFWSLGMLKVCGEVAVFCTCVFEAQAIRGVQEDRERTTFNCKIWFRPKRWKRIMADELQTHEEIVRIILIDCLVMCQGNGKILTLVILESPPWPFRDMHRRHSSQTYRLSWIMLSCCLHFFRECWIIIHLSLDLWTLYLWIFKVMNKISRSLLPIYKWKIQSYKQNWTCTTQRLSQRF